MLFGNATVIVVFSSLLNFEKPHSPLIENFTEGWNFKTIKDEGKIYTACGDGRIPFVSAFDIAAVVFRALTDEKSHNTDHRILGPELMTYDQVCLIAGLLCELLLTLSE